MQRYNSFSESYPFHLSEHNTIGCRRIHYIGNLLAIFAFIIFFCSLNVQWVFPAPVPGYSSNWKGQIIQEYVAWNTDSTIQRENSIPKVDNTRMHIRVQDSVFAGMTFRIHFRHLQEPEVYIPLHRMRARKFDLLIHFHGESRAVKYAAREFNASIVAVSINLGEIAATYADAFSDTSRFSDLLRGTVNTIEKKLKRPIQIRRIFLSCFGEGYAAVREIISVKSNLPKLYAVIMLDGMRAKYVPDRKELEGEGIDSTELQPILELAKQAANPNLNIKFLATHSEIFPGTFAGATECSDYIIGQLGLKRNSTMKHGPLGMQQLSRARRNHFEILGFAGNTLPDHFDHLEALYHFLRAVVRL
ncbi:MAG: DUF962 domain-containing protein [Candidatus Kryptoniota bacterium]